MKCRIELGSLLALSLLLTAQAAEVRRYDFAKGGNAAGHPAYDAVRGFGFEPAQPTQFSVRLPEGNYRVTLTFARHRADSAVTVRAEQRRLLAQMPAARGPRSLRRSFIVNLRTPALSRRAPDGLPRAVVLNPHEVGSLNWDDKLTLELAPWPVDLRTLEIQPAQVPTLYLVGDSTVTDRERAPDASWGQFLTRYFDDGMAVANHAESGESLKSFVTELRLEKLLAALRPGDWVMIQFGHNDQKPESPETFVEAGSTYRSWLRTYLGEIRHRGATPLLVSSPERRNFDSRGRIRPTLAEYAAAMRAVAKEDKVALLDLNAASVRLYEALGPALAPRAFADGGDDRTHHNEYGADLLARAIIEALRGANAALTAGLERHIAQDAGQLDLASPPLPD